MEWTLTVILGKVCHSKHEMKPATSKISGVFLWTAGLDVCIIFTTVSGMAKSYFEKENGELNDTVAPGPKILPNFHKWGLVKIDLL